MMQWTSITGSVTYSKTAVTLLMKNENFKASIFFQNWDQSTEVIKAILKA